jgi:thiopeptide-type bacteriocin biosynthesis protein
MIKNEKKIWLSAFLFFEGDIYSRNGDRVILEVVDPVVRYSFQNGLIERYFFIRYSERGTHIRLRVFGHINVLETWIKPFIENLVKKNLPIDIRINESKSDIKTLEWVDYEPEYERYGGIDAIKVAEDFFQFSSEFCIEQLKHIPDSEQSVRFGKGIIGMITLLKVFFEKKNPALRLIKNYGNSYLKGFAKEDHMTEWLKIFDSGFKRQSESIVDYIDTLWEALGERDQLSKSIILFSDNIKNIKDRLKFIFDDGKIVLYQNKIENWDMVLEAIVPSYIHMTNNRLGISIRDESYLSHIIAAALQKTIVVNS